jgi:hypothetical protein
LCPFKADHDFILCTLGNKGGIIERVYCPQADVDVGVAYSQWNYGVDRYAQGPSGSVVFFSALDSVTLNTRLSSERLPT